MSDLRVAMLWHTGAANNLGLGALTWSDLALVHRAAEAAGVDVELELVVTGEPKLDRIDPVPAGVRLTQVMVPSTARRSPTAFRRLRAVLADADVALDIGAGDSFASIYGTAGLYRQLFTKAAALAARTPLVLAPQTLGPFTTTGALGARLVARRAVLVVCRDGASAAMARSWGCRDVRAVADVAFALEPRAMQVARGPGRNVGFNVSGLLHRSVPGDRYHVAGYRALVERALRALVARPDTTVHLVPHVVALGGELGKEDYGIARELAAAEPALVLPEPFVTAGEAKGYVAQLDGLITSRLHASIAAVGSGVPAIAIAYSTKFLDTLGQVGYEPPLVTIDPADLDDGVRQVLDAVDRLPSLAPVAARAAETAAASLDDYVEVLGALLGRLATPRAA